MDSFDALQSLQGDLPLISEALVQDGGRDYVELPLTEVGRISPPAVCLGEEAEDIDLRPTLREIIIWTLPVGVAAIVLFYAVAGQGLGDREHRPRRSFPNPLLEDGGAFDLHPLALVYDVTLAPSLFGDGHVGAEGCVHDKLGKVASWPPVP